MNKTMKKCTKVFYITILVLLCGCSNNDYTEGPGEPENGGTIQPGPTDATSYTIIADIPADIRQLQIPSGGTLRVSQKFGQQDVSNMEIKGSEAVYIMPAIDDGDYTIDITINLDIVGANSVVLAYASKQISVSSINREVRAEAASFTFPDDDNDQYTNLVEIMKSTNPLDPSDFPNPQSPIITTGSLYYSNYTNDSVDIGWPEVVKANADSILQYTLYYSTQNNINTVGETLTNGVAYGQPTNRNTITVSGLPDYRNYTWNVIVRDQDGNTGIYIANKFGAVLDNKFGENGVVIEQFGSDYTRGGFIAKDADGNFVVTGSQSLPVCCNGVIARFLKDGSLDTSWNSVGYIKMDSRAETSGVAIDLLGRTVVVGNRSGYNYNKHMSVWRLNPDGRADKSFNGVGSSIFMADDINSISSGNRVAFDNEGRLVVSGVTSSTVDRVNYATIWRFNIDGSLDTSFNGVGYVSNISPSFGGKLVFDEVGNILVIQSIYNVKAKLDYVSGVDPVVTMVILRYRQDGVLDNGFGRKGMVTIGPVGQTYLSTGASDIVAIDGGWILTGAQYGSNVASTSDMMIWKLTRDGQLDTSFNSKGYVLFNSFGNGFDRGSCLAVDSKNRIVVSGVGGNVDMNMAIWRYTIDGKSDRSFGENAGYLSYTKAKYSSASCMILDSEDNITVFGTSTAGAANLPGGRKYYQGLAIWKYTN